MFGRVEVEADDVADLVDEEGIGRKLEVLLPVGLEVERGPEARDREFGQPRWHRAGRCVEEPL